ncbi:hypothetical protein Tco_0355118 [Tanacetum coccineum]
MALMAFSDSENKSYKSKVYFVAVVRSNTSKSVNEVEPKKVRKNNDAPIIEDWGNPQHMIHDLLTVGCASTCLVTWPDLNDFQAVVMEVMFIKEVLWWYNPVNTISLDVNIGSLRLNVVGPSVSTASPNEEDSTQSTKD